MSRGNGSANIVRQDDGSFVGAWGIHVLKSAFQPIFAFHDGRLEIAGFEGLIRPHRDGQVLAPGSFFGNVAAGDRLHVENLCRNLHLINGGACLDPATLLFVNFDPSVFNAREIADAALREMRLVLSSAGIDPRRIVCEVTEQRSSSQQALASFVEALRAHGFRIAVDDYGAADSDLERVSALKPDIVKFDARWITRLMDSRPGFALLSTMVSQFASHGIQTVFEGIEEAWQLELAEQSGASMVQGYVLAKPELAPTSFAMFSTERASRQGMSSVVSSHLPVPNTADGAHKPAKRVFGRRIAT